jgi:CheY-like chemotaxis protein
MPSNRVLIVANRKKDRQALRAGIESLRQDLQVSDGSSGEEALLLVSRQPPDLLVSEFHLAGISGRELMQKLRGCKAIIIAGGQDAVGIQEQVLAAGAQAFFTTPVDMVAFLQAVQEVLSLTRGATPAEVEFAEAITASAPPTDPPTLASSMERLRRELDAFTVLLAAESGEIVAQAGEIPPVSGKVSLDPALGNLIQASTGLSHIIGKQPPQDLLCISGLHFDLYLAHAGQSQALVALTRPEASIQRLEQIMHILLATANALAQDLINAAIAEAQPALPAKRQTDGLATGRLGALLSQAPEVERRAQEVDSFWEAAAEQAYHEGLPMAGSLSYEQARKLGLTPKEPD